MSQVLIVLGKRGSGKSVRLRALLQTESRFILYNTLGEPTYSEFEQVGSFPDLCKVLAARKPILRVSYVWDGRMEREKDFDFVCQAVYEAGDCILAVDEIDLFTAPTYMPRHLDRVVSLGRHRGVRFWCASRRPKEIHPLIRSQASRIVSFTQIEPLDLDWCRQVMGDEALKLPSLQRFTPLDWQDGQEIGGLDMDDHKP